MKIRLPVRKPGPPPQRPPKLKLKASVARARRAPIVEEEDFMEEPEPNMRLSHAFVVVLVLHVIAVAGVFAFNSIKAGRAEIFAATKDQPAKTAATTTEDPAAANASNPAPASNDTTEPSNGEAVSPQPIATAPAPVQPAIAAAPANVPAASSAKTHELQPGETLTKVAAEYGVTVAELQKVNNITDPKKLRPGLVLNLPAGSAKTAVSVPVTAQPIATKPVAAAATEAATSGTKDSGKIYTVVKGDNPVKIAKHLKVRYADLLALNGNFDPRKLQIGQKLKIPATTAAK